MAVTQELSVARHEVEAANASHGQRYVKNNGDSVKENSVREISDVCRAVDWPGEKRVLIRDRVRRDTPDAGTLNAGEGTLNADAKAETVLHPEAWQFVKKIG